MTEAEKQYDLWCSDLYFDQETRDELKKISGNTGEIEDRFYRSLEFGTGGLRGDEPDEPLYGTQGFSGTGKLHY